MNRRPQVTIVAPDASLEEAAAALAALERFIRDTAPVARAAAEPAIGPWRRAALAEGVARQPQLPPASW